MTANKNSSAIKYIGSLVIYSLVFSIVIIPYSTFFGINPKIILLIIGIILVISASKVYKIDGNFLNLFIIIILFYILIILNYFISNNSKGLFAIKHLMAITSTIIVSSLIIYSYIKNIINYKNFIEVILIALTIFGLIKLAINLLLFGGLIDFLQYKIFHYNVFFEEYEAQDIAYGFKRFTYPIDLLYPVMLFIVLSREKINLRINKYLCKIFLAISIISIFISYSRFLFLLFLFAIFINLMTPDNFVYDLYTSRFLSDDVVAGDQIRSDQFAILMESFMKSPILGQGIGYGADAMIRDPEAPYSYEIQWLAMLMQFGIIGSLLILSIYLSPMMLLNKNINKASISMIAIYLITLVSGFSNPYLLSSQFSLIYSTIFISLLHVKGG